MVVLRNARACTAATGRCHRRRRRPTLYIVPAYYIIYCTTYNQVDDKTDDAAQRGNAAETRDDRPTVCVCVLGEKHTAKERAGGEACVRLILYVYKIRLYGSRQERFVGE